MQKNKSGFTLVELIVVVIIVGILAAIGLPQYTKILEKSRSAEAEMGLGNIAQAQKLYFAMNQGYYMPQNAAAAATFPSDFIATTPVNDDKKLDINLGDRSNWKFSLSATGSSSSFTTFTATATRQKGACATNTIVRDDTGTEISNSWLTCQIGL